MALPPAPLPAFVRAQGGIRLTVGATPRGSAPLAVAESGGFRVRFPRGLSICEGVLINTGGGMAGGDRFDLRAELAPNAEAVLTTSAAEKVYRSDGADAHVGLSFTLQPGSRLDWLPQEGILFSGAKLRRRLDVAVAPEAQATLAETVVFGRAAMGEAFEAGAFHDRWRIRRGGRLVFAEDVRLEGSCRTILARRAVAGGARALATVLHVARDTEARRDEARTLLRNARSECGLSAWDGMMVARFLSPDPQVLRIDLAHFLEGLCGRSLPRSWQT